MLSHFRPGFFPQHRSLTLQARPHPHIFMQRQPAARHIKGSRERESSPTPYQNTITNLQDASLLGGCCLRVRARGVPQPRAPASSAPMHAGLFDLRFFPQALAAPGVEPRLCVVLLKSRCKQYGGEALVGGPVGGHVGGKNRRARHFDHGQTPSVWCLPRCCRRSQRGPPSSGATMIPFTAWFFCCHLPGSLCFGSCRDSPSLLPAAAPLLRA